MLGKKSVGRCVNSDSILCVFLFELRLSKLFQLVYIQEIFLSCSTTVQTGHSSSSAMTFNLLSLPFP